MGWETWRVSVGFDVVLRFFCWFVFVNGVFGASVFLGVFGFWWLLPFCLVLRRGNDGKLVLASKVIVG